MLWNRCRNYRLFTRTSVTASAVLFLATLRGAQAAPIPPGDLLAGDRPDAGAATSGTPGALSFGTSLTGSTGFSFTLAPQATTGSRPALVANPNPTNFFSRWQARATRIQSQQPKWMVPAISAYPMLVQVFRADFTRQISPSGARTWSLDSSRGLNLIPFNRAEFDVLLPPYLEHGDRTLDGFGDLSFLGKVRILSANEKHGNYLLSAQLVGVVPTGSHKNGATDASVNPTINGGKGWGRFDVITNVGATLPTGNTNTIGRTLTTGTAVQYHVGKYLWPEVEINSTRWYGSARDGKIQTFLAPGIVVGRFPLSHVKTARRGFVAGVTFQTAATTYHAYNHNLIFSGRYIF